MAGSVAAVPHCVSQCVPHCVDATAELLSNAGYIADRSLATAVFLALELHRPLLLEGEAGVGKTEIALALARGLGRRLIRLPCYEGLDLAAAVYEWNYSRQMIEIRLADAAGGGARERLADDIFSERFLLKRPLLQALEASPTGAPVLLIDELDRADEPFEAFLLELLSDYQVTIPELGTIRADEPPIVVITSNRTREIHDALRRRCAYYWIDYPSAERELAIVRQRVPQAGETLSTQVVQFVQALRSTELRSTELRSTELRSTELRSTDLFKLPGIAETIEWTRALIALDCTRLEPAVVDDTLGMLLKYQDDILRIRGVEARGVLEAALARGVRTESDPA